MSGRDLDALTVAAVQPRCAPYDVGTNARIHAELVSRAAARVVVFPEMSITGYELDAPVVDPDNDQLGPIVEACDLAGAIALVGAPVGSSVGDHIAFLRIDSAGVRVVYHKMWLGDAESTRFVPGDEPIVIEIDGWRLGLAVCKDTGVVEHAAATAAVGMDVYVAGVLDSADDAAIQEARARRITADHGVWMVVASFAGSTGGGFASAAASSRIWSPDGEVVARAGRATGGIARASLTPTRPQQTVPA